MLVRNDSLLHHYIRQCQSPTRLGEIITKSLEKEAIIRMAGVLNDDGHSIYDVCYFYHFGSDRYQPILDLLLPLILTSNLKLLHPPSIDLFLESKNHALHMHLKIAREAMTYARSLIQYSSTHPAINTFPLDKKNKIDNQYEVIKKYRNQLLKEKFGMTRPTFTSESMLKEYLFIFETVVKQSKFANCEDLSYIILSYVSKKYPRLSHSIQSIINGDHFFNIIGENDSAVLCDAWSGKICPANQKEKFLKDLRVIKINNTFYNHLVSFNPDYHKIQTMLTNQLLLPPLFKRNKEAHDQLLQNKIHKGIMTQGKRTKFSIK
jgi:hypothetical protein